jgi:dihydroneopterin aldolase
MAGDGEEEPMTVGKGGGGDKLILRGMQFHGFHGVKQEEKKLGQKFVIDVDAWMDLAAAGDSDDISHTVSYTDIYRCRALPLPPLGPVQPLNSATDEKRA